MSKLEQAIDEVKCNPEKLCEIFIETSQYMTDEEWLLLPMDMDTFCEMFMGRVNAGIRDRAEQAK